MVLRTYFVDFGKSQQGRTAASEAEFVQRFGVGFEPVATLPASLALGVTTMHLFRLISAVAIMLMSLPGCSPARTTDQSLQMVDVEQANGLIAGKPKLLGLTRAAAGTWVDPRTEAEFAAGHIPGAINLPYASVRAEHKSLLKDVPLVIVYGSDYNDPVAIGMSKTLMELGHKDVHTLRGGLRAWTTAGYSLETGEPGALDASAGSSP